MALNWFLTLRNLSKTDEQAKALYELLQKAETDEEKESAKQQARDYIEQKENHDRDIVNTETTDTKTEETPVEEPVDVVEEQPIDADSTDTISDNNDSDVAGKEEEARLMDMSAPAFNPRLARCGITREEELFLNHVFVRKLTHEEKILMRRSIYQKKTERNNKIQAEFRAKRLEQKQKDLADPEKQKFHQERKYLSAIVNALEQHKNMIWLFSQVDGLTPDVVRELLKKPANVNAIRVHNDKFIENFYKKYGV